MRPFVSPKPGPALGFTLLLAASLPPVPPLFAGDGDFDPTWGTAGISSSFAASVPRAAGVAPDQQSYFTGNTTLSDDSEFEWWRSGSSGGGQWWGCSIGLPLLDDFDIREVLFDSSDRLLYAGTTTVFGTETVERAFVARLTSFATGESCTLDTAFSGAGWEYFDDAPYCDTEDCRLIDIAESGDATTRYVALLESVQNFLVSDYYLVGLTAAGNLDPNFGSGGFAPVTAPDSGVLGGGGAELVVDRSHRPLVLYAYYDPAASLDLDGALTRFQSNGDLDATFAVLGTYFIDGNDNVMDSRPLALAIGNDGRLALSITWVGETSSLLEVLQESGTWMGGINFGPRELRALAFDGLGRLLMASDVVGSDGFDVARRIPTQGQTLQLDTAFGVGGTRFVDIDGGGANGETPVDLETPGGQPMILVEADQIVGGPAAVLVRLENSLVFADGFEWGSTKFW